MDTYLHKTMASVASLEKIEIIRSQEFMASEARLKFLKKMIILGPKTAILGPQFCRILVLGPHFWWSGGARGPPLDPPLHLLVCPVIVSLSTFRQLHWNLWNRIYFRIQFVFHIQKLTQKGFTVPVLVSCHYCPARYGTSNETKGTVLFPKKLP